MIRAYGALSIMFRMTPSDRERVGFVQDMLAQLPEAEPSLDGRAGVEIASLNRRDRVSILHDILTALAASRTFITSDANTTVGDHARRRHLLAAGE